MRIARRRTAELLEAGGVPGNKSGQVAAEVANGRDLNERVRPSPILKTHGEHDVIISLRIVFGANPGLRPIRLINRHQYSSLTQ
jgi:hypothetical protein